MRRRSFLAVPSALSGLRVLVRAQEPPRRFHIEPPLLNDVFVASAKQFASLLEPGKSALETQAHLIESLSHFGASDRLPKAIACLHIGDLYHHTEEPLMALHYHQLALALIPAEEKTLRFDTLTRIAVAYDDLHQKHQAADYYSRALELAPETGERLLVANTFHNRGEAYLDGGDFKRAEEDFDQAHEIWKTVIGRTTEWQQEHWDAMIGEQATAGALARMRYKQGDLGVAETIFTRLIGFAYQARSISGRATALVGLGKVRLKQGQSEDAIKAFREACEIWRNNRDRRRAAVALSTLGLALNAAGRPDEALGQLQQCRQILHENGNHVDEAVALFQTAAVEAGRGNVQEALAALRLAADVQEGVRGQANVERFRGNAGDRLADLYQNTLLLMFEFGKPTDAEAFRVSERSRARNLLDQMSRVQTYSAEAISPDLRKEEVKLRAKKDDIERNLQREQTREGADFKRALITDLQQKFSAAQRTYEDWWNRVRLSQTSAAALQAAPVLTLEQAKAAIPPSTVLLCYYLAGNKSFCFVIQRDSFNCVPLGVSESKIEQQIRRYTLNWGNNEPFPASLQELWKYLIDPVMPYIGSKETVGIVPHRALNYIPFAALSKNKTCLGSEHPLFSIPSVSLLDVLSRRKRRRGRLVAIAQSSAPNLPPLMEIDGAVRRLSRLYRTGEVEARLGPKATPAALREMAVEASTLLIAAHADLDDENPLFARIFLGPDEDRSTPDSSATGIVELHEVYQLGLAGSDLVVLSGCRTGIASTTRGDDLMGLHSAFLAAGTRSVMATLWEVEERAVAAFLPEFFKEFHGRNNSKVKALQQAQQNMRSAFPRPRDWASFVLTGDPGL